MTTHTGGCHCGQVRFQFSAPPDMEATDCNCSICAMTGFLHLFVPQSDFKLLSGESELTTYTFNTQAAKHMFCRICGVKSFYIPRSHPNAYSVNANCLDPGTLRLSKITVFDGQNWEESIDELLSGD